MEGAKETKLKGKNVLNMILEQAVEDDLLRRNLLHSRNIRIAGRASQPTEPYTVEQMSFLVQGISRIKNPQDRAYLALHALHPLRLEEVLGLKGRALTSKGVSFTLSAQSHIPLVIRLTSKIQRRMPAEGQ